MLRIGLTGGMGAGKSTVARALAERGAVIIDSDVIAREVVAPGTAGLAALAAAFGPEILAPDGSLDRPALAARAFADDESRTTLNSITHPLVGKRTSELLAAAPADAIVVQDIPLLVENGMAAFVDLVLIVDVDAETRIRRLVEFRGVPENDARARIAAQATDEQRREVADVLLDNSGPAGSIEPVVHELWERRLVPFEHNRRTSTVAYAPPSPVPADPEWPAQARRLIARLRIACGAHAERIDHVGPTAVAELSARDVLDIQITVGDAAAVEEVRSALVAAGFPVDAEAAGAADTPAAGSVHGSADPGRPAEISVRVEGSPAEAFALSYLDLLRGDADARAEHLATQAEAETAASGLTGTEARAAYRAVESRLLERAQRRIDG